MSSEADSARQAPRPRALGCPRCGGALRAGVEPAQLVCGYCAFTSLRPGDGGVEAWMPAGRIGRRRAGAVVAQAVSGAGVRGFAIESTQLLYVPFWSLQLKLVGWQRYRVRRRAPIDPAPDDWRAPAPRPASALLPRSVPPLPLEDEPVEELVARDVTYSTPACDARELGLLGIADHTGALRFRPFDPDRLHRDELACAVVHPLAAARRNARLYHGARLAPAGASELHQRLDILRTRAELVYYPVYRVRYRSGQLAHWATVDGVRGRVLAGTLPWRRSDWTPAWLTAGALSSFCAGAHVALGLLALGAWAWARLRARRGPAARVSLAEWLTEELGRAPVGAAELRPGRGRAAAPAVPARGRAPQSSGRMAWN